MRYSGSKRRFSKDIIPIITQKIDDDFLYYEPFAGGMNIMGDVPLKNKYANDINEYVIALWTEIQKKGDLSFLNRDITEDVYYAAKQEYLNQSILPCSKRKFHDYEIGFIGACCSYGGAWFNGYAHYNVKKKEDHIKEAFSGLEKQINSFYNIGSTVFTCGDYQDVFHDIKRRNMVIYADPPYASSKQYESEFDTLAFWDWCRYVAKMGIRIYISEYDAPSDFICIWHKEKSDGMGTTKNGRSQDVKIEKLFIPNI